MIAKFREELGKVGVKGFVVQFKFGNRFAESDRPAKAGAYSLKCAPNAIDFTIRAQQIGGFYLLKANGRGWRKILAQRVERRVDRGTEILKCRIGVAVPIAGQEMVVKHVGEDSPESAVSGAEKDDAPANDGVRVGEGVNLTMALDAALELATQALEFPRWKNVRQQIPNSKSGRRLRKEKMSQPVHGE
jgi:hypothetical protein